jgi:hypothetical protein
MKKLLISIFLMLSMVVSGLSSLQFTPVASAINKSAVRCDFLGQYINPNSDGKKCEPCPVDFYCPLVSGTEIENCASKGYPDSDCKETRRIFSTDKAIACPAGTTTKGFTFNTLVGTRITENGDDLFPIVGQGATDKTMCQAPDFKCPADKPVLLRTFDSNGVAQEAKCFPVNTCAEDQIAILKNGIPDCSVACKNQTLVNGKCYQDCPDGEYLEVSTTNNNGIKTQTVLCKKITIVKKDCPIIGQTPSVPGDLSTCVCTTPQVVSTDKTKCELPVVPCAAPQTGNQPNCVNPPIKTCPANTYGYSEPNCKPCPQGGTSPAGTVDSSGCVIVVVPCPANYYGTNGNVLCTPCPNGGTSPAGTQTIAGCSVVVAPCPANYYGVNGNVLCTPCPNGQTSAQGTQDASGCKGQENGGGGFCSGFWGIICGAVVATTIDCFLTKVLCNKPQPSAPVVNKPTTNTQRVNNPTAPRQGYQYISRSQSSSSSCQASNANYAFDLQNISPEYHFDKKTGHNFFWIQTRVEGGKTTYLSTIRKMDGAEVPALKCLFTRYLEARAGTEGIRLGNQIYNKSLKDDGILHGRQLSPSSPGYNHECIDITELLAVIENYDVRENANQSSVEWAVARTGTTVALTPWFATKDGAYNSARELKLNGSIIDVTNTISLPKQKVRKPVKRVFNNIFGSIKASAALAENVEEVDALSLPEEEITIDFNNIIDLPIEEGDVIPELGGDTSETEQYPCNGSDLIFNVNDDIQTKIDGLAAQGCDYYDYEDDTSGDSQVSGQDDNYSQYLSPDCDQYSPYDYDGTCMDIGTLKQALGDISSTDTVNNALGIDGLSDCSSNTDFPETRYSTLGFIVCLTPNEAFTLTQDEIDAIYSGDVSSTYTINNPLDLGDLSGSTNSDDNSDQLSYLEEASKCNAASDTAWNSDTNTCDRYQETNNDNNYDSQNNVDTSIVNNYNLGLGDLSGSTNSDDNSDQLSYLEEASKCNAASDTAWNSDTNTCDPYENQ